MPSERPDSQPPAGPAPPESRPPRRLIEIARLMLRLGFTAFGGPAAHVAMMSDEVVKRRRWLTEQQFLDLLGASGLIPGPTSTQVALHVGMARGGVAGLWVAGVCFIAPAVLITLAFAWAYVAFGSLPAATGLLLGIKPAVVAIIGCAVWGLARKAAKSAPLALLGAGVLTLYLLGGSAIWLLLGAGALGVLFAQPWRASRNAPLSAVSLLKLSLPALASAASGATGPTAGSVFLYFLKIGCVLFGGGYVLLAFLRNGLVHQLGWLNERQLLDAVAVGQFTPGPLFSTATFVGYVVGASRGGAAAGLADAAAASLGIFLPSFILVWATHSSVRRLREASWSAGFLDGVNAGSIGLMAGVLSILARGALVSWPEWVILALALGAILRFRMNSAWIVVGAGALGALLLR